jgi:hypothetical protein
VLEAYRRQGLSAPELLREFPSLLDCDRSAEHQALCQRVAEAQEDFELAEAGIEEWARGLAEDVGGLCD